MEKSKREKNKFPKLKINRRGKNEARRWAQQLANQEDKLVQSQNELTQNQASRQ